MINNFYKFLKKRQEITNLEDTKQFKDKISISSLSVKLSDGIKLTAELAKSIAFHISFFPEFI